MNLTLTQQNMMRRFGSGALNVIAFTTGPNGGDGMNAKTVKTNLAALHDLGLLMHGKTGFKLTQAGRNWLDGPGQLVAPARVTNASTKERYVPSPWESVRPGADDHQRYSSKGMV